MIVLENQEALNQFATSFLIGMFQVTYMAIIFGAISIWMFRVIMDICLSIVDYVYDHFDLDRIFFWNRGVKRNADSK